MIDKLCVDYGTGLPSGLKKLETIITEIKSAGRRLKYDCVVGVSGGTDSSFLLCKALDWGLRPLAVHYDNTWNTAIATQNISKITKALDVDLYTHVVNNREVDDIKRAFLMAGVPEFDADTDIGFVQVLRSTAARYGLKYILEGHSFMTEGISPVGGKIYVDGGYVADVHDKYGKLKRKTFPNMTFWQFMKWILCYRQRFIRPLWYIDYNKETAREYLHKRTGWEYYAGHHLENRASAFTHTVWLPQCFGIDFRNLTLAASVRRGVLNRKDAIKAYRTPVAADPELVAFVKKRTLINDDEYNKCINGLKRTYLDFRTYKKRFEHLRLLFYFLTKANFVPMSFYLKYCFPIKDD